MIYCVFLYIENWVKGVSMKSTKLQNKVLKLSNFFGHFPLMDSGVLPTMGLSMLKCLKWSFESHFDIAQRIDHDYPMLSWPH